MKVAHFIFIPCWFPTILVLAQGHEESGDNDNGNDRPQVLGVEQSIGKRNQPVSIRNVNSYGSIKKIKHTITDIFKDASLSLVHSLQHDIFSTASTKNNGSSSSDTSTTSTTLFLQPDEQRAFLEWIDLLYWTLPPSPWKAPMIIHDIRTNVDFQNVNQFEMIQIVTNHREAILDGTQSQWSQSCSEHQAGRGHVCGIWNLLHIVSIGIAERHGAVLGDKEKIATAHATQTIMDYIECFITDKFFKETFSQVSRNECGNKKPCSSTRFREDKNKVKYWHEPALWLWEIHNKIKIMSYEKKVTKEGTGMSKKEEDKLIWPSQDDCPKCRKKGELLEWDEDELYSFLKSKYWPTGVHHFRYVVLGKKREEEVAKNSTTRNEHLYNTLIKIASIIFLCIALIMKKGSRIDNKKGLNEDSLNMKKS